MAQPSTREGFAVIDWKAPLDLAASRAALPAGGAVIKGMFIDGVLRGCARRGHDLKWPKKFVAFKEYDVRDYLDVCEAAAGALFAKHSMREGLRRVGHMAYPDLVDSLIGRVIFGVLGRDVRSISKLVSKAYEIAGKPGRATLLELHDDATVVRLEDIHTYIDTLQVGAFEGVLQACALDGEVRIKRLSPSSAEFWTCWWPVGQADPRSPRSNG
jgi:uncharacterized protein (TIGR02265 family)